MKRFFLCCLLLCSTTAHAARAFHIDPAHTRISFVVEQLGITLFSAHFTDFSGLFHVDREGSSGSIEVTVQTHSLDGSDADMTAQARSAEWLDIERFPEMRFLAGPAEYRDADHAQATGLLTLHGVTKPVRLDIAFLDCAASAPADQACRFKAQAEIRRSDFGLPHGFWVAGDAVHIRIDGAGIP